MEMYKAFSEGRSDKDPIETWYQGEIGFFDFYVIPLAKKLDECGVFGVSSHEYLSYAETNRREWERKGREIVEELAAKVRKVERRLSQRILRRLSSSGTQKSTTMTRQGSFRGILSRQPSLKGKRGPNALARASRTASMRALMEKVWEKTDVLNDVADHPTGSQSTHSKGPTLKVHHTQPENTLPTDGRAKDPTRSLKRNRSSENMRFT